MWDGNGKFQKYFPVFWTDTGKQKKNLLFGTGREIPISFPAVWEWENHAFLLGNIREGEFHLIPVFISSIIVLKLSKK